MRETNPEVPYCRFHKSRLNFLRICPEGDTSSDGDWYWTASNVILNMDKIPHEHLKALCNPRRVKASIRAEGRDGALVSFFDLGTLTPEEMLEYDAFTLLSVEEEN